MKKDTDWLIICGQEKMLDVKIQMSKSNENNIYSCRKMIICI